IGDDIEDGPNGTSSYLVDISNGGTLIMENNILEKGRNSTNHSAAVVIGAEGITQRTGELTFKNNSFTNSMSQGTIFVRNMTATEALVTGNKLKGQIVTLSGDGSVK